MSSTDLETVDFFSPELLECPFDLYRQLQDEAPVFRLPGTNVFMVTRHSDIREVVRDTRRFSSMFGELINETEPPGEVQAVYDEGFAMVEPLLTQGPPRHKTYRSLANVVFSQIGLAGMRGCG